MTGLVIVLGAWAFADIALRVLNILRERNDLFTRTLRESKRREWNRQDREP